MAWLLPYGVATASGTHIRIPIPKAGSSEFAVGADWTYAAGDVKVVKNGGAEANITTDPAYSNGAWEFQLSGTELQAKTVELHIKDQTDPKVIVDQFVIIEAYGHASAKYPANIARAWSQR